MGGTSLKFLYHLVDILFYFAIYVFKIMFLYVDIDTVQTVIIYVK